MFKFIAIVFLSSIALAGSPDFITQHEQLILDTETLAGPVCQ